MLSSPGALRGLTILKYNLTTEVSLALHKGNSLALNYYRGVSVPLEASVEGVRLTKSKEAGMEPSVLPCCFGLLL